MFLKLNTSSIETKFILASHTIFKKIELDVKVYANAFTSNKNFLKLLMYVPCNRVNKKHSIPSTQNSGELEQ